MCESEQNNIGEAECENGFPSNEVYNEEYREYVAKRRFNRTPLIIALAGLIFSVFYGAGIVLAIISLVMAAKRYRIHKSEPLRWAIVISITAIVLCLAFILALSGAALLAYIKQIEQETENVSAIFRVF